MIPTLHDGDNRKLRVVTLHLPRNLGHEIRAPVVANRLRCFTLGHIVNNSVMFQLEKSKACSLAPLRGALRHVAVQREHDLVLIDWLPFAVFVFLDVDHARLNIMPVEDNYGSFM